MKPAGEIVWIAAAYLVRYGTGLAALSADAWIVKLVGLAILAVSIYVDFRR